MSIPCASSIVPALEDFFSGQVIYRVSLFRSLRRKAGELGGELNKLKAVKNEVDAAVFRNSGGDPGYRVRVWLDDVKKFLKSSDNFRRRYEERPSSCNCLCRCGALENYNLAEEANKLLQQASDLKTEGDQFLRNIDPLGQGAPARVEYSPIYDPVVGQEEEFQKVLKLIEEDDDSIGVVGIWGMGGIGKTTLLKRINNHFFNNSTTSGFDVVIFTEQHKNSGSSSILEMQKDIEKRLGIFQSKTRDERSGISNLKTRDERKNQTRILKPLRSKIGNEMLGMSHLETGDEADESERANRIFKSLRSKSFLLLLDGLWEVKDLKRLGIPPLNSSFMEGRELLQQQQKKKQKVVVTTRDWGICREMRSTRRSIVEMRLLSNEMSWDLFCKHVNNKQLLERNLDVRPLARDVADKCDRLPLALTTVGKAMSRYEEAYEWSNAKEELQRSQFKPMKEKVLPILKFSFDRLESDYLRHMLFFFTSLPPPGIHGRIYTANLVTEIDARSGSNWKSARDVALTRISKVIKSGLLIYTDETKDYVKLQDCVYEMLCSLAETESYKYGNIMLRWSPPHSREQQHWLSKFIRRWECAQNISMEGCDLTEIPSDVEMPNCSVLRCLYWPDGKLLRFPEHFFDRMTCLRALDLLRSDIDELPRSFGNQLVNLKLLNLSGSRIKKLPEHGKSAAIGVLGPRFYGTTGAYSLQLFLGVRRKSRGV